MPFCTPIWRLRFKGGKDAATTEKVASRGRLDNETTTADNKSRPNEDNKPKVLTKEEKLKEQRKNGVEKLRETLRQRRELLVGIVEVPLKKGTIEGYQIRVVHGPSQGVMRSPCNEPYKPQHTKRLLELQAEQVVKKEGQSEHTDEQKTKPTDGNKCKRDLCKIYKDKKPVEQPSVKKKSEKDREKSGRHKKMKPNDNDNDNEKIKTIDTPSRSVKEAANTKTSAWVVSPKCKEHCKGAEPSEQRHEKLSKFEEGEGHEETPDDRKHSKVNDGGQHDGADITTDEEGEEYATAGEEPTVGELKKSMKSKKKGKS